MYKKLTRTIAALALVLGAATFALTADKASGTIVAIAEGVADVKGADGKTYQIKVADIVAEDLKTGDMVEYEVIEGKPVNVKKPAKK
jgi:hypothetical protein